MGNGLGMVMEVGINQIDLHGLGMWLVGVIIIEYTDLYEIHLALDFEFDEADYLIIDLILT